MLRLFKGTCEAVRAMHSYSGRTSKQPQSNVPKKSRQGEGAARHSDDDERFPQPEGDGEEGYSYGSVNMPLVTRIRPEDDGEVVFDGDEETREAGPSESGEVEPYAHRDLKPG
jgi:serine/threonine kinase 16